MPEPSLPTIIHWCKSITTHDYAHGVQLHGLPSFRHRRWQRSFHACIIHADAELDRIRQYIHGNPDA